MIDWRRSFFSAGGRCARTPFWIGVGVLILLSALYEGAAGTELRLLTFWFVDPALLASATCVLAKRLHDRGRSGWWAALILLAWVVMWPGSRGAGAAAAWLVIIWSVVELGLMPGEQGANRHGQSPMTAPVR